MRSLRLRGRRGRGCVARCRPGSLLGGRRDYGGGAGSILVGIPARAVADLRQEDRYRDNRDADGKGKCVFLQRIATPIRLNTLC